MFLTVAQSPSKATCVRAIDASTSGILNGVPVTVILQYGGGNGFAESATAEWVSDEYDSPETETLPIRAIGQGAGDKMNAFFAGRYLYVQNDQYLRGEGHCCNTTVAVQRFEMVVGPKGKNALRESGTAQAPYIREGPVANGGPSCPQDMWDAEYLHSQENRLHKKQTDAIVSAAYKPFEPPSARR